MVLSRRQFMHSQTRKLCVLLQYLLLLHICMDCGGDVCVHGCMCVFLCFLVAMNQWDIVFFLFYWSLSARFTH